MRHWHRIAASAAILTCGLALGHRAGAAPASGTPAPEFTAETLAGKKLSLADYRGKSAVILNFFASW
jgi:hypothetical protein